MSTYPLMKPLYCQLYLLQVYALLSGILYVILPTIILIVCYSLILATLIKRRMKRKSIFRSRDAAFKALTNKVSKCYYNDSTASAYSIKAGRAVCPQNPVYSHHKPAYNN